MNALEEHFREPRNAGPLRDADIHVEVENPVCGDLLHLHVKIAGEGDGAEVSDARFQVYGCPAAIAAGSALTELLLGRSRAALAELAAEDIDRALGGLPAEKSHAAVLARDAAHQLAALWTKRHG